MVGQAPVWDFVLNPVHRAKRDELAGILYRIDYPRWRFENERIASTRERYLNTARELLRHGTLPAVIEASGGYAP